MTIFSEIAAQNFYCESLRFIIIIILKLLPNGKKPPNFFLKMVENSRKNALR